jgi:hypothetical protein
MCLLENGAKVAAVDPTLRRLLADFEMAVREHARQPNDSRWRRMEEARQRLIAAVAACSDVLSRVVYDFPLHPCAFCGEDARCAPDCIRTLAHQALFYLVSRAP